MDNAELERRRGLTFEQAEGAAALPGQLRKEDIPPALRSAIWQIIHDPLEANAQHIINGRTVWYSFLKDVFANYFHRMVDEYNRPAAIKLVKSNISTGDYIKFYGVIQYVCRYRPESLGIHEKIGACLVRFRAPYRLIDATLVPIATDEEHDAILTGISVAKSSALAGTSTHLQKAADAASEGAWADSVRESIHAVESAARQITGADSLGSALTKLAKAGHIHAAMNEGFKRLYGYTSDEGGIRHALLEDGDANVTETDSLFMLGACASFVTYLITSARNAGLLQARGGQ